VTSLSSSFGGGARTSGDPPDHISVLVIEDEPLIARMVARVLASEGFHVDLAADGGEGLTSARRRRYGLILLDLLLPLVDGVEVLRDILARDPAQRIVVVSAVADVDSKVRCLRIGACDYLVKPFALSELVARVRARMREGVASPGGRFIHGGSVVLDVHHRMADAGRGVVALSQREFALLQSMMAMGGRIATREELLAAVWGESAHGASNVVDATVARLRAKLGDDVISTVRQVGYRFDP
jgi:DNA-binding response OmpR family regulator